MFTIVCNALSVAAVVHIAVSMVSWPTQLALLSGQVPSPAPMPRS